MDCSAVSRIPSPSLPDGFLSNEDGPISWPGTEHVHAGLVKAAINKEMNICFLTPSLAHEHLDLLATEALFSLLGSDRRSVLVMSADTSFRERFMELRPDAKAPYSKHRWPVANVSHDGGLTMKSRNWKNADHFPGFIFRRTSTQLPRKDIGEQVGCVIYDDTVKYTDERWDRFKQWLDECNVPTAIICLRDPLSDLADRLPGGVKWGWSPRHLDAVHRKASPTEGNPSCHPTTQTERVNSLLDQKLSGIKYEVHVCDGEAGDHLSELWDAVSDFEELANDIDTFEMEGAVGRLKSSVGVLSRMVSSLDVTDDYYMRHPKHISLLSRLDGLKGYTDTLSGEAKSAATTGEYREIVDEFDELYEDWGDLDLNSRKQGALLRLLRSIADDEESVHVLVPDETSVQALKANLELNHPKFYDRLSPLLEVTSSQGLPLEEPTDNLVFYGPLKYDQRWLLRAPHGRQVTVLAYPHELGLLATQVRYLNGVLNEWTNRDGTAAVFDYDYVDEELPAAEEIGITVPERGDWSSERVDEYEFDTGEAASAGEIIDSYKDKFEWKDSAAAADLERSDEDRADRVEGRGGRQREAVADCYDVHFADGEAVYVAPSEKVHVIDADGEAVKKPIGAVTPGDVVITLKNKDVIREKVRELLIDRGDIDLVYHAEMWRNELQRAIDRSGDDFDDFVEKCQDAGITRGEDALEDWFNDEVAYTRYKSDMKKLAEAYELDDVRDNFEAVWTATQVMKNIGTRLMSELRKRAYQSGLSDEVMLSDKYDVRLSDFSVTDESGEEIVKAHEVTNVIEGVEVPRYRLGKRRKSD